MTLKFIGHRGNGRTIDTPFAANKAPEHTLLSFRQAFESGADGIEFDIFLTNDNIPVIYYCDELNGKPLSSLSLKEVKKIDLPQGQKIPTLDETLTLVAQLNEQRPEHDFIVNVELKGKSVVEPSMKVIDNYIDVSGLNWNQFSFSSFDWDKLSLVKNLAPDARIQPTIATIRLFDAEQVQMPGYFVGLSAVYNREAIDTLGEYIQTRDCSAIDTPPLDIRPDLIEQARQWDVGFCTHPTGPRREEQAPQLHETLRLLDEFSRQTTVDVCLKVDDIEVAGEVLEDCRQGRPYNREKLERIGGVPFLKI